MPLQAVHHTGAAAFAMKLLFSTALFGIALVLLFVAGRPGHELGKRWLWLIMPQAVVAISAGTELSMATPPQREAMWIGSRLEEHTSSLSSLIRISYSAFRFKKKTP